MVAWIRVLLVIGVMSMLACGGQETSSNLDGTQTIQLENADWGDENSQIFLRHFMIFCAIDNSNPNRPLYPDLDVCLNYCDAAHAIYPHEQINNVVKATINQEQAKFLPNPDLPSILDRCLVSGS